MNTQTFQHPHQIRHTGYGASVLRILALLAGLLVALVAYFPSGSVTAQIVCASLSLSLLGFAAALQMAHGQRLLDSLAAGQLGPWFGASSAIVFGLASLIWIAPPTGSTVLISIDSVLTAMVVAAVALGCFTVGYGIAPRRPVHGAARWLQRVIVTEWPVRAGQGTAWLLLGIAFVAYVAQTANGTFGYLSDPATAVTSGNPISQLLFVIGSFSVFAVALSANDYARQRGAGRLLSFALLLAAQSIVGAFSANKEIVALGFLAALFGYAASDRRLPIAGVAAAACIFVFVVVPFTTSYRSQIAVGNSRLSPVEVLQAASQQGLAFFVPAPQAGQGQSPVTETLDRVSRIGDLAIIVQRTTPSDIAYRPLTELLEAPLLGFVPRAIWPEKPILDTGYLFSQQYYDLPASIYTSNAITPEGDLWRHGGWLVLIAGMLLFGFGVRILDAATADVRKVPLRLLIVLTFFPLIVKQETDAVSLLAAVPSLLVGVALAARVVTLQSGRPSRPVRRP